jgi:E3 Ubiquitin ligase
LELDPSFRYSIPFVRGKQERTVLAFLILSIPMNYLSVLACLEIAGGLYFFSIGFQLLARKRLLLATPNSRIRSAALGLVEINGVATGPHTMPAPITGKPCFLYRTIAWQRSEGKNHDWQKVADETLHLPFFVDDTTGKMLIEPLGADLDLRRNFREEYSASMFFTSFDVPPQVGAFLARHGVSTDHELRIEEYSIKPGDPLFVAGTLAENPGVEVRPVSPRTVERDPRDNSPTSEIIRLYGGAPASSAEGMSQQAKIAAALTRAGITKPEAWSAAGVPFQSVNMANNPNPIPSPSPGPSPMTAAVQVQERASVAGTQFDGQRALQNHIESSAFSLTPPVVLMKGANDPTFVISFRSQKEFVGALTWKSAGMVWGGSAITLLGLYMLLAQMGLVSN